MTQPSRHSGRPDLPMGTVTFLFSDIEGSTELAERLAPATFAALLEQHHRLLRDVFARYGGVERGTQGDSFLVVFRDAPSAVAAAVDGQREIAAATWPGDAADTPVRVRMGLHTGEGIAGGDDYVGIDINRAARIAGTAHGGQIVISDATRVLAERALPAGVTIRDAGAHRLKGLVLPERLHTLTVDGLPSDFPPLRSVAAATDGALVHLPARSTSFIGRDAELAALHDMLATDRLITLVGAGGTGKTSLAIELARSVAAQHPDGAWFVPLESVSDPGLVASAIVAALGLRDRSESAAANLLADNLSARSLLLVLDNLEHLLDAAPLIGRLLGAAATCRFIVTSRAPLHISGEQVFPVPPLAIPELRDGVDVTALGTASSVQLLVERARRVRPAFTLTLDNAAAVAGICRLLDGLPLGIEIAAARVSLMGPAAVLDRLTRDAALPGPGSRDAPVRQRTLQAAIAWSYELLDPGARRTFARCSAFSGGWQLDEALTVCGDPDGPDPTDTLLALVDQSLVTTVDQADGVRFGMLETVGRFAAARLTDLDPPDATVARRHALAYLAVAEACGARIGTSANGPATLRIGEERDNLWRAIAWTIEAGEVVLGQRFGAALWRYWWVHGELERGVAALEAIGKLPGGLAPTQDRMRALEALGGLYYYAVDSDRTLAAYQARLALARELGDDQGVADGLHDLLFTEDFTGRIAEGIGRVDEVTDAYRAVGDRRGIARCGWTRSNVYQLNGDALSARESLLEVLPVLRELDDVAYEQFASSSLAVSDFALGNVRPGIRWFLTSIDALRRLGDDPGVTLVLPLLAAVAERFGDQRSAATITAAYEALARRYGAQMPRRLQQVVRMLERPPSEPAPPPLPDEAAARAAEAGRTMTMREVVAFVTETLGRLSESA